MSIGRLIRIWASANLLLAVILPLGAYAGFIDFECQTDHPWDFDSTSVELNLWENIEMVGCDEVLMNGATDSDPRFHVTETITNNSGLNWIGYELILSGTGVSFDYTNEPTSNYFNTADTEPLKLTFYYSPPDVVPQGVAVTLGFDINVATSGLFKFTLTQNPVAQNPLPEPATIAMLGLGTLSLLRSSRRRREPQPGRKR